MAQQDEDHAHSSLQLHRRPLGAAGTCSLLETAKPGLPSLPRGLALPLPPPWSLWLKLELWILLSERRGGNKHHIKVRMTLHQRLPWTRQSLPWTRQRLPKRGSICWPYVVPLNLQLDLLLLSKQLITWDGKKLRSSKDLQSWLWTL